MFLYENTLMQYTVIFKVEKNEFSEKCFDIFIIFAQNIECRYTSEPPRRGGSNEYPQSMFCIEIKNRCMYSPAYPTEFCYIKVGFKDTCIHFTDLFS